MFQCLLKIINCHKDNRSGKYMKIPSVLTHLEIYSNCFVIPVILIVERVEAFLDKLMHSYSSEWYELFNLYIRRILSIGSHVFPLAPDFADNEIIQKWRNYSLWNTRSSWPEAMNINKSNSENNIFTVWTAFVMISEKLQESASVFSNSLNRRTGLRNLFHELCSSLPFNVHAISTTFEFVSSRLALRTSVGDRALPESDMCYNIHVIPDHNLVRNSSYLLLLFFFKASFQPTCCN